MYHHHYYYYYYYHLSMITHARISFDSSTIERGKLRENRESGRRKERF